ncbi:MAG: hypothetical protein R2865_16205 [Deinococcales bacterium]
MKMLRSRQNARLYSDVDSALPYSPQSFDIVLMNPFHAGKQVILDIPKAFFSRCPASFKSRRRTPI